MHSNNTTNTANNNVIHLDDIHKDYHLGQTVVRALRGVSITINSGEYWAIMGPSGSGKSTMLNLLGCLDRPTKGQYLFQGDDVSNLDDDQLSDIRLQRIGFIFQGFNLVQQLTVKENIELPMLYLGVDPHESHHRSLELAEQVGLEDRLHHRPVELSGGQQQRVAIARAMANNPAILLADEPTGNLDTATGHQILELLTTLNQQGKTIIMVTHEPDVAQLTRTQLHMIDGKIASIEGDN